MSLWQFLRDRLIMILIYFLSIGLAILVIQLDVLQTGLFIHTENIVYLFILAFVLLILYLVVSYARQLTYYRELNRIKKAKGLDRIIGLQSAVTQEQKYVQGLFRETYKDYIQSLNHFQELQDRHHDFINQWVHNMKTPVSVINLLVQQESGVETIGEARTLFKSVEEEVERLTQGLEMVLHAARLERFEGDVYLKSVDLVGLIRNVINENKKLMIRSTIFPKLVCSRDTVYVETDPKWLTFVLKQVTSNAIKYTPKGKSKGIIYDLDESNGDVLLCIKDEGVGIPKEDLPRVFDPFFTGENGSAGSDSTGMGLYFVKEVCGRLGHKLWVESDFGQGTTVCLSFSNESIHHELLET